MMRTVKSIIFLLTMFFCAEAQTNFSKAFRKGHFACYIENSILKNDTIIAYGGVADSTWNAWLIKMDTSGNVISENRYPMEPFPEYFLSESSWGLIETSDGGYGMCGATYFKTRGVFIKTKPNGQQDFIAYHEVDSSKIELVKFLDVAESSNNYLVLAYKNLWGFHFTEAYQSSILIFDKNGKLLNEVSYPKMTSYQNITKLADNEFLLNGGGTINGKNISIGLIIDSLGIIKKTIYGPVDSVSYIHKIQKSKNGWVYLSKYTYYVPSPDIVSSEIYLVGTDENFQNRWQKKIGYPSPYSQSNKLCAIGNDEFLALVSMKPASTTFPTLSYNGAFIQKFNGKGDLIWSRMDTIFWKGVQCTNEFVSAHALPSGNIILTGWAEKCYGPTEERGSYTWVAKISSNGCLLEPACGLSAVGQNFDIQQFRAYPNPASEWFQVEWKIPTDADWQFRLFDNWGRMIQYSNIIPGSIHMQSELKDLNDGLYFYNITDTLGKQVFSGRILIQK